jgi:proton-dependent oligopeptide transporter, POT family
MSAEYRTKPLLKSGLPPGLFHIIGNEAAERFSFYGMRGILIVFMTTYLLSSTGEVDVMSDADAKFWYHMFIFGVYAFGIAGAFLSDGVLGKYKTIIILSVVYCFGHLALAIDDTRVGLMLGLFLITVGSGGIKPCVSAHVGDQFGSENKGLLERVMSWFYIAINVGALAGMLLTPKLLENPDYGPRWAFGVPGVLMLVATVVFWMGRKRFAHIPPAGMSFIKETFSRKGMAIVGRLSLIYAFVAVFWALYDQTGSAWVLQSKAMDLHFMGVEWLPAQVQAINPVLIVLFALTFPLAYKRIDPYVKLTPLRKIGIGFVLTVLAFVLTAYVESMITAGQTPSIVWQLLCYVVLTAAEVMVSITCLEFSYTQAPPKMKSLIMAIFLASVALGNLFTSIVNWFIQNDDGSLKLVGGEYYLFFAAVMAVATLLFVPVALRFKEHTYIQGDDEAVAT